MLRYVLQFKKYTVIFYKHNLNVYHSLLYFPSFLMTDIYFDDYFNKMY